MSLALMQPHQRAVVAAWAPVAWPHPERAGKPLDVFGQIDTDVSDEWPLGLYRNYRRLGCLMHRRF